MCATHHGDQVTKPLMGQLVSHHQCHPLLCCRGRVGRVARVDEQGWLTVGDQPPVLHVTRCEVGDSNQVNFGQWVCDVEVVLVESESLYCNPKRAKILRRGINWISSLQNICLTGKIWVGLASFSSLSYINFGKFVLRSGNFQTLFWRLNQIDDTSTPIHSLRTCGPP